MIEILKSSEFWTFAGVLLTGIIGYLAGRRKNKAEVETLEVNNDREILSTYKNELEYFRKQLELTRTELASMRLEIDKLTKFACNKSDCTNREK